jgi:hypothetical protein
MDQKRGAFSSRFARQIRPGTGRLWFQGVAIWGLKKCNMDVTLCNIDRREGARAVRRRDGIAGGRLSGASSL